MVGTKPEIIKYSPVIAELTRRDIPVTIIHSGQHYTAALEPSFDDLHERKFFSRGPKESWT